MARGITAAAAAAARAAASRAAGAVGDVRNKMVAGDEAGAAGAWRQQQNDAASDSSAPEWE